MTEKHFRDTFGDIQNSHKIKKVDSHNIFPDFTGESRAASSQINWVWNNIFQKKTFFWLFSNVSDCSFITKKKSKVASIYRVWTNLDDNQN